MELSGFYGGFYGGFSQHQNQMTSQQQNQITQRDNQKIPKEVRFLQYLLFIIVLLIFR